MFKPDFSYFFVVLLATVRATKFNLIMKVDCKNLVSAGFWKRPVFWGIHKWIFDRNGLQHYTFSSSDSYLQRLEDISSLVFLTL